MKRLKYYFKLIFFKFKWRLKNKINFTTVENIFDLKNVKVGKYSYGKLKIHSYGAINEGLNIGSFVSIASGVEFILGGNHRYDCISTYPFKVNILKHIGESYSKGEIIIEDDVWIGTNAIILSGVVVGKGSIIGDNCVVAAGSIINGAFDKNLLIRNKRELITTEIAYKE